jgi:putative sigma-54 modulation protein
MKITIKATNTTLTPAIEEYITKKLAHLEKLVDADDTSSHIAVEVGKENEHHKSGDVFFAEFTMHIAHKDFRVRENGSDIYAAIDVAKDELTDAVRGFKGKQTTLLKRGGKAVKDMLRGWKSK